MRAPLLLTLLATPVLATPVLATPAHAERPAPTFAPDRPALGQSPATPGPGFATVEVGLAGSVGGGPVAVGTQAWTLRLGVDEGLEARLVLPDLVASEEGVATGPLAAGVKIAGRPGERWGVSAVPELLIDLSGAGVGWRLSANAGLNADRFALWANATTTVLDGVEVLAGGGGSIAFDGGGIYLNGGREVVSGRTLAGGGAWFLLSALSQIDVGCDLWIAGSDVVAVPMIGGSLAF